MILASVRPTMESSRIKANTFENMCKILGNDNMRNIFEFDDTYKNIYSKQVVQTVWKESWKHWFRTSSECQNPFVSTVVSYLFNIWGISHNNGTLYFKKNYLPSDITIESYEVVEDSVYSVYVYIDHHLVMNVLVSTIDYNNAEYMGIEYDEESVFYNMMEVFTKDGYVMYMDCGF